MLVFANRFDDDVWWLISRASGTAAVLFSSAAITIALLYKLIGERERAIKLGAVHEVLGLATVLAVFAHGFILFQDTFLNITVKQIFVPFSEPYMRIAFGIGIIAGYLMIAFALVYYLRRPLGRQRFRMLHRITVVAWLLALAHSAMMGTDTSMWWYLIIALPFVISVPVAAGTRLWYELDKRNEAAAAGVPSA